MQHEDFADNETSSLLSNVSNHDASMLMREEEYQIPSEEDDERNGGTVRANALPLHN